MYTVSCFYIYAQITTSYMRNIRKEDLEMNNWFFKIMMAVSKALFIMGVIAGIYFWFVK